MRSYDRRYYVYLMTNMANTVLYIGVTGDLIRRIYQHRENLLPGFTRKYRIKKLVYFEEYANPLDAIAREKQLKAGSREKKVALIEKSNPKWLDLYDSLL